MAEQQSSTSNQWVENYLDALVRLFSQSNHSKVKHAYKYLIDTDCIPFCASLVRNAVRGLTGRSVAPVQVEADIERKGDTQYENLKRLVCADFPGLFLRGGACLQNMQTSVSFRPDQGVASRGTLDRHKKLRFALRSQCAAFMER